MGHSVSDAAAASVKKSEKKEAKKARTDEEIFRDIDVLLTAGLSVPPLDIRLLLTRHNELLAALEVDGPSGNVVKANLKRSNVGTN